MSQKNDIRISSETRKLLTQQRKPTETWNAFFRRLNRQARLYSRMREQGFLKMENLDDPDSDAD